MSKALWLSSDTQFDSSLSLSWVRLKPQPAGKTVPLLPPAKANPCTSLGRRRRWSPTCRSGGDRRCSPWRSARVSCAGGGTASTIPLRSSNAGRFTTPSPAITSITSITPSVGSFVLRPCSLSPFE